MPESASESSCNRLRKKRPERQLYVPPAQRTRRGLLSENFPQNENDDAKSKIVSKITNRKKEGCEIDVNKQYTTKEFKIDKDIENDSEVRYKNETDGRFLDDQKCTKSTETNQDINYIYILWEYRISKNNYDIPDYFCELISYPYFNYCHYTSFYKKVPIYIYNKSSSNILYILYKNYVLWQPKIDINYIKGDNHCANSRTYPQYNFDAFLKYYNVDYQVKVSLVSYNLETVYEKVLSSFDSSAFRALKELWNENRCSFPKNDVIDLSSINYGHIFIVHNKNESDYIYNCEEDHSLLECYLDKTKTKEFVKKPTNEIFESIVCQSDTPLIKSGIVLEERSTSKSLNKNEATVQKNNIKNSTTNLYISSNDLIKNININKIIESPKRANEHEQEKEIMRKTKKYLNRKTRPLMKYVDHASDMLQIGKNDNVNDWEDLFDDDQLQEKLFKEVDHEVGTDISIVGAEEDYSDYAPKQSEDLEHMVELYDFPPTLATHDIIQAFSEINSDAMYVKWVDDTHAILVLGSLKQAQRAVELDNSLIRVRPMTAASSVSLAMAYRNDLKPAMKRPPTNLQTARRLITAHLGTKSKISREQNAKERNDLKAARELKKLARKNEQDAWEGNLRSSTN